jgi:hypothetical protein
VPEADIPPFVRSASSVAMSSRPSRLPAASPAFAGFPFGVSGVDNRNYFKIYQVLPTSDPLFE